MIFLKRLIFKTNLHSMKFSENEIFGVIMGDGDNYLLMIPNYINLFNCSINKNLLFSSSFFVYDWIRRREWDTSFFFFNWCLLSFAWNRLKYCAKLFKYECFQYKFCWNNSKIIEISKTEVNFCVYFFNFRHIYTFA